MKLADGLLRRTDYVPGDLFGMRFHPIDKVYKMHDGVDIKTYKNKWPIYSLEHGIVENVGYDKLIGNFVRIIYRRIGYTVFLYHKDDILLKKKQQIGPLTLIGHVGNTGKSTGVHLHIGVKRIGSDEWIDPNTIDYIPPNDELLIEDGILDTKTLYKLQLYYKLFPDCEISGQVNLDLIKKFKFIKFGTSGSNLFKAIQKDLSITVDGKAGKQTIKAMQKSTGTPVTGIILEKNDPMILEIQKRINRGIKLWG